MDFARYFDRAGPAPGGLARETRRIADDSRSAAATSEVKAVSDLTDPDIKSASLSNGQKSLAVVSARY